MDFIVLIMSAAGIIQVTRKSLDTPKYLPQWDKVLSKVWLASIPLFALAQIPGFDFIEELYRVLIFCIFLFTIYLLRDFRSARLLMLALVPCGAVYAVTHLLMWLAPSFFEPYSGFFDTANGFSVLWMFGFGAYATIQNNKERKVRTKQEELARQAEARKAELEHLVVERTTELTEQKETLEKALADLKAAQVQLIHAEKMASLGELTAGIAHEIQNPLNFVNNFSELSVELAQELNEELAKPEPDKDLVVDLARDLVQNQQKINHHGKRAASIVTGMLQHSRTSTGKKEPTDLNALADEYLRLSYHGLRAKDSTFNAKMVTDFDPAVGKVDVIPQDMGRVLLNLINNAFYAVQQRARVGAPLAGARGSGARGSDARGSDARGSGAREGRPYEPTVTVSTQKTGNQIVIKIKDNGTGIPDSVKARIFQPFFTTKPTGQGTGLGLSLAYDIVTKGHGGALEVASAEGVGTEFVIYLPN